MKTYQIFFKQKCIYKSLNEKDFKEIWEMIDHFVDASGAVEKTDLSYKECMD